MESVGVQILNATHEKYLFRSIYTKRILGLVPRIQITDKWFRTTVLSPLSVI